MIQTNTVITGDCMSVLRDMAKPPKRKSQTDRKNRQRQGPVYLVDL